LKRGELYRVRHPSRQDPKRFRVFAVVSRQALIDSRFSTVMCVPAYAAYDGLATQVQVGVEEGLAHESSLHCDEVVSLAKGVLADYVGTLSPRKVAALNSALRVALDLPD
jgi:mRNA interferase MazF